MATFAWTWESSLLDGLEDVVLAYFCGLPMFPYELVSHSPFRFDFVRGTRSAGILGQIYIGKLRSTLTVTCRPTPQREVEWSFNYDVFSTVYEGCGNSLKDLESALSEEVDSFLEYYAAFVRNPRRLSHLDAESTGIDLADGKD